MNLVGAFIKMIRLPNLIFIVLTQVLFHITVLDTILLPIGIRPTIDGWNFILLSVASVLIAAAGYIINDYFDINIDQINKPTANVVDKIVSRRWAMAWHFVLSGFGIILSAWLAWRTGLWYILIGNFICYSEYVSIIKERVLVKKLQIIWVIMLVAVSCQERYDPPVTSSGTTTPSTPSAGPSVA